MAGFMAGFGSAFSKSYDAAVDREKDLENDIFKMRYADYITRRDKYEERDRENKKLWESAKTIARATGNPLEATNDFYNMLQGGMAYKDVYELGMNNRAVISNAAPDAGSAVNADDGGGAGNMAQQAQGAVDSQMQESGMSPPQDGGIFSTQQGGPTSSQGGPTPPSMPGQGNPTPAQDADMQAKEGMQQEQASGGVLSGLGNMMQRGAENRQSRMNSRINDKMLQVTGSSQQDMDKIMGSQMQGSPVPSAPGKQVTWKPIGVMGAKPNFSQINTIGDAAYAKAWTSLYGSSEEKKLTSAIYDQLMTVEAEQKKAEGIAMGTYTDPVRGSIRNQATGKWDGGIAVREPDGNGGFVWKDGEGKVIDEKNIYKYTKNMEDELTAQSKEFGKPVMDYNKKLIDFTGLVRTSTEMEQLTRKFPQAMGLSGDISQGIDALRRAGVNILEIINPKLDPEGNVVVDQGVMGKLEQAEQAANSMLQGVTDRNAQNALAATLIDIKATRLAYMWAQAAGAGSGKGISNQDFENFRNAAKGGENPEGVAISAASFIKQQYQDLKTTESILNQYSGAIQQFEAKYHVKSPFEPATSVDKMIGSDADLRQQFEHFLDISKNNSLTNSGGSSAKEPETGTPIGQGLKAIGKTKDGKIVYEDPNTGKRYIE